MVFTKDIFGRTMDLTCRALRRMLIGANCFNDTLGSVFLRICVERESQYSNMIVPAGTDTDAVKVISEAPYTRERFELELAARSHGVAD